jgi:hypothetical protein
MGSGKTAGGRAAVGVYGSPFDGAAPLGKGRQDSKTIFALAGRAMNFLIPGIPEYFFKGLVTIQATIFVDRH